MPTPEEVEKFKRAFKAAAKAKNKKIRWDEPSGCFAFLKTQTSLAGILDKLEDLQRDPTVENIKLVQDEIAKVPKDKALKYKDAIDALKLSLQQAAIQPVEEEEPVSIVDKPPPVLHVPSMDQDDESEISDVDDEPERPDFDLGVKPGESVVDTFVSNLGSLPGWKQEQEKKSLLPLDDRHTTTYFRKDELDLYSKEPKYIPGKVPTTQDDATCVGQKLEDFPRNEQALVGVSLEVIAGIRSKLTKGPFNNYLNLPESITEKHLIPEDLITAKLKDECKGMNLPKLKTHARQMFKVDDVSADELEEQIQQYDDYLETVDEDSDEYANALAAREGLATKLEKLDKISKLTSVDDLGEWLKETPAPGWWNSVVDTAAGLAAEMAKKKYKDIDDKKIQMACLGRATLEVGGGVCSKMAMATHGELTTKLPPGSEIAQVFHNFDHEFVVARVPGGRWFVVDPWPHNPAVVPFVDSYFDPKDVEHFVVTTVKETCDHPYGVDLDTGFDWKAIIEQAKAETKLGSVEMKGTYGHASGCDKNVDPQLRGTSTWG